MMTKIKFATVLFGLILGLPAVISRAAPKRADQAPLTKIVAAIRKADYEDDLPALDRLYRETDRYLGQGGPDSRILYWRGFAMWRAAINGGNDSVKPTQLAHELDVAIQEFRASLANDPKFVDAKLGEASCLMFRAYVDPSDPAKAKELMPQIVKVLAECNAEAANNPRNYWVRGAGIWYVPVDRGGGQEAAIAGYLKGLELSRKVKPLPKDSIEPAWGEPELLMSLAWSNLNKREPDPKAAEAYGRQALKLVPRWHYVRDILMPQIQKARRGAN